MTHILVTENSTLSNNKEKLAPQECGLACSSLWVVEYLCNGQCKSVFL